MDQQSAQRLCEAFDLSKALFGADVITAPVLEILVRLRTAEFDGEAVTCSSLARQLQLGSLVTARWLSLLRKRGAVHARESDPASGSETTFRLDHGYGQKLDQLLALAGR